MRESKQRRAASVWVGHEDALETLTRWRREGVQLVGLAGPAGVGKSRLMRELGTRAAREGARVVWCDVSGCAAEGELAEALWASLGAHDGALGDALGALAARLNAIGPVLVLLDGADACREALERCLPGWLDAALACDVVVTARARLDVDGAQVWALRPLSRADGVRLYRARAAALRGGVASPGDAAAVELLVERLDGLPLAIELAASRARVMAPLELLDALEQGLEVLESRAGRGVEAALAASWRALDPDLRQAWAQCAVFAGRFTLRDARAVLEPEDTVARCVEALCDHSIVHPAPAHGADRRPGFVMLRVVRQFGMERLGELGQREAATRRHALWFVEEGERQARGEPSALLAWVADAFEQLTAVHRRCVESAPELSARVAQLLVPLVGLQQTALSRLTMLDVDATPAQLDPGLRAAALLARADARQRSGARDSALDDLLEADLLIQRSASLQMRLEVVTALARSYRKQRQHAPALAAYQRALALAEQLRHPRRSAHLHVRIGRLHARLREANPAEDHFRRAQDLAQTLEDIELLAAVLHDWGLLCVDQERCGQGVSLLEQARALCDDAPTMARLAVVLDAELGRLSHRSGDLAAAHSALERASQRVGALSDSELAHRIVLALAAVRLERGELERAAADLSGHDPGRSRRARVEVAALQALVCLARGALDKADALLAEAYRGAGRAKSKRLQLRVVAARGLVAARQADTQAARAAWARLDALSRSDPAIAALVALGRAATDDASLPPLGAWPAPFVRAARAAWTMSARAEVAQAASTGGPSTTPPQPPATTAPHGPVLVLRLDTDARWLTMPDGATVNLRRRPVTRRLVLALVAQHTAAPGTALSTEAMIEAGWPGENLIPSAARNRLYVALSGLRKLGLEGALYTRQDGYLLAPNVVVERVAPPVR